MSQNKPHGEGEGFGEGWPKGVKGKENARTVVFEITDRIYSVFFFLFPFHMTELAVTIHDPGEVLFEKRLRSFLDEADVITAAGALETGTVNKRLHWQLAIKFNGNAEYFRRKLLKEFPTLKGTRKGGMYSVANCRKSWEVNVCYAMKGVDIPNHQKNMTILKNIFVDDILRFRVNYLEENKPTQKIRNKPWNTQIAESCIDKGIHSEEGIICEIIHFYLHASKTLPDEKFMIPRMLQTIRLIMRSILKPDDLDEEIDRIANRILMYT